MEEAETLLKSETSTIRSPGSELVRPDDRNGHAAASRARGRLGPPETILAEKCADQGDAAMYSSWRG